MEPILNRHERRAEKYKETHAPQLKRKAGLEKDRIVRKKQRQEKHNRKQELAHTKAVKRKELAKTTKIK